MLDALLPRTGHARRVGITGVPGVGKSTFIDALGMHLIRDRGESVAVLSVDPSSPISGGSILGDKTRMERLAVEESAFIRPSPSQGHLGGVARRTRETILLCEAAGYRNILVETVGVGQSETAVRSMTDFFLLLMLAGAGDELQGMKRGIIEMLDGMAINKADGDNRPKAERARMEYAGALHLFPASADGWSPRVLTCSSTDNAGIAEVWQMVLDHRALLEGNGYLAQLRNRQALQWMNELTMLGLEEQFRRDCAVAARLPVLREEVRAGRVTPFAASRELLALFRFQPNDKRIERRDFMIASFPVLTAAEAASLIQNGQNVGFSGFTPAGAPKAIPMAIADRAIAAHNAGAGVPDRCPDRRLDGAFAGWRLVEGEGDEVSHAVPDERRICATASTPGKTRFFDLHLSLMPQVTRYGFLGPVDVAVVEAADRDGGRRHRADQSAWAPRRRSAIWRSG